MQMLVSVQNCSVPRNTRRHHSHAFRMVVALCSLIIASCSPAPESGSEFQTEDSVIREVATDSGGLRALDLDFETILKCARLSKAVYARPGTAQYNTQKEQYEKDYFVVWKEFDYKVTLMRDTHTLKSFLVLRDDKKKEQFVCVAGTDGYADWKVNFEYPFKAELAGTGIFVHPQFAGLARELYRKELKDELRDDYTTIVTGHSLGGAIAAVIGMLIQHDGKGDLQHVITFGQPKFTNLSKDDLDDSSGIFIQREFPLLRS